MKPFPHLLLIVILCISNSMFCQDISIGERHSFESKLLNEERSYQVYLPPSYHENLKVEFPVLYLLDGDYNFHYDTGLVEFLSNTAFTIPEMIVIGISDEGSAKQLQNSNPKENADAFINFISSELKPLINKTYRTSKLDILAGHSKFGLLVTHYWMTQPNDFDVFLAIDPSYWFNENDIIKQLENTLQNQKTPHSKLYIAQANTEGMGIDEFVSALKKELPNASNWHLSKYPEDNHGSLHLKAISDALTNVFKGWDLDRETFYSLKNGNEIVNHYKTLKDKYSTEFLLPWYSLGNIIYFYVRKDQHEDLKLLEDGIKTHFPSSLETYRIQLASNYIRFEKMDDAEQLYNICLEENQKSYKALEGLSKIYASKNNEIKKVEYLNKAITYAKEQHARQYYLNELYSLLD